MRVFANDPSDEDSLYYAQLTLVGDARVDALLASSAYSVDVDVQLSTFDPYYYNGTGPQLAFAFDTSTASVGFFTGLSRFYGHRTWNALNAGVVVHYNESVCQAAVNSSDCIVYVNELLPEIPLSIGALTTPWLHVRARVTRADAQTRLVDVHVASPTQTFVDARAIAVAATPGAAASLSLVVGGASLRAANFVLATESPPASTIPPSSPPPPLPPKLPFRSAVLFCSASFALLAISLLVIVVLTITRQRRAVSAAAVEPRRMSRHHVADTSPPPVYNIIRLAPATTPISLPPQYTAPEPRYQQVSDALIR